MSSNISHGTVVNVLFSAYAIFVATYLLDTLQPVVHEETQNTWVGVLIFIILFAEVLAIYWKNQALASRLEEKEYDELSDYILLIWLAHLVLSTFLVMMALISIGIHFETHPISWTIILFGSIIREIVILTLFLSPPKPMIDKEIAADFILTVFACIAYTAFWGVMAGDIGNVFEKYQTGEAIVQLTVSVLLFYIAFLPTRFGFFTEDVLAWKTNGRLPWIISLILAGIAGISPLIL